MVEESEEPTLLVKTVSNPIVQFLTKLGVNSIPVVGPAMSMALGDYFSKRETERLQQLIDELHSRVAGLEDRLSRDAVLREDFPDLFAEVARQYVRTGDRVRQDYLAGFLVAAMSENREKHERDFFLKKIGELSTLHLELLRLAYDPVRSVQMKCTDLQAVRTLDLKGLMTFYFPGTDEDLIRAAHRELHAQGFFSTDGDIYGVMMSSTGMNAFGGFLTPLGRRFVESCLPLGDTK